MLKPVRAFPDPIRGGDDVLVMCEVMLVDGKPHPTNTRAAAARTAKKYKKHEPLFGIEQEYTMLKPNGNPLGFPDDGFPAPQGPYYCGVGETRSRPTHRRGPHGRLPRRRDRDLGHQRRGHARPVGVPGRPASACSKLPTSSGSPAGCCTASPRTTASSISIDAKPVKGDWNGAGAHTNFSTKEMREDGGYKYIEAGVQGARRQGRPAHQQLRRRR